MSSVTHSDPYGAEDAATGVRIHALANTFLPMRALEEFQVLFHAGVDRHLYGRSFAFPMAFADTTNDAQADAIWLGPSGADRTFLLVHDGLTRESSTSRHCQSCSPTFVSRSTCPSKTLPPCAGSGGVEFYNLLDGKTTTTPREAHVRLFHDVVSDIRHAVDDDRSRLRAALLMPVSDDHRSLYDAAVAGDDDVLRGTASILIDRLHRGDVRGLIRRPSPRFEDRGRRRRDFLSGYADEPEGEGDR